MKDRFPSESYSYHNSASKVTFRNYARGLNLPVKLGDGPILASDGYGGWVEIGRPGNKPVVHWEGAAALKLKIPLMFDRDRERHPIQGHVNTILGLGRRRGGTAEPISFTLTGPALSPYTSPSKRWVLNETPEVSNVRRNRDGVLWHQEMTITVLELIDADDTIRFQQLPRRVKTIEAKKGDTINKIARRIWKGEGKKVIRAMAKEMAKLNKVRDRNRVLKTGRRIKVPPRKK